MKTRKLWIVRGIVLTTMAGALGLAGLARAQEERTEAQEPSGSYATRGPESSQRYASSELAAGSWGAGGSAGLLGGTPDDSAFAMNTHADYFLTDRVSIGPLAQFAFTDDMFQFGLSGQGKYWIELPGTNGRGRMALQSGIGFVHSDFANADTSWLVPVGIGYEHALDSGLDLTATTLVNFTNLHTGFGSGADVMPGVTFGVRF